MMTTIPALRPISPYLHEIPRDDTRGMRVPARVYANDLLLAKIGVDRSLQQLVNVTMLPGIVSAAFGMPDMHEGYGFPVGGVAATLLPDGAISPGGIGFDINCGVRLLVSGMHSSELRSKVPQIVHEISRSIPSGYGRGGRSPLAANELDRVLDEGCPYLIHALGLGYSEDLDKIESGGHIEGADAGCVSERAKSRGHDQLGTLGGGNHFVEVQVVDDIFDDVAARVLGLEAGGVTVLIHTGSRGLGHQVCTDYVRTMDEASARYGFALPDRQLASVPFSSREGQRYFAAMAAAANFAWCNRQMIAHRIRQVFERILAPHPGRNLRLAYDVGHNTAKLEQADGRAVCVHRKGATRAFGPSAAELPEAYRNIGQPVFIPGSMGTASYVLVGTDAARDLSLASTCHGAGRALSRGAAKHQVGGHDVRRQLEAAGITVRCPSNTELAEEAPIAYKDVDEVVEVVHQAGLARKVARLRPLGVVKG